MFFVDVIRCNREDFHTKVTIWDHKVHFPSFFVTVIVISEFDCELNFRWMFLDLVRR
jgi:hypothetical protein